MRKVVLIVFISFILWSCKEKTSYRMHILVKNDTDCKQTVQLFPKSYYLKENRNDLYMYSDIGNGDFGDKCFEIEEGKSNTIFISSDFKLEPSELAMRVFDSIFIIPSNEDKALIKFYPDTVLGYSDNLFDSMSIWEYEKYNYDEPNNFNRNPVESYDYSFVISIDKY